MRRANEKARWRRLIAASMVFAAATCSWRYCASPLIFAAWQPVLKASDMRYWSHPSCRSVACAAEQQPPEGLSLGHVALSGHQVWRPLPLGTSFAVMDLAPILAGHVVVASERAVARLAELSQQEYLDFWRSVHAAEKSVVAQYQAHAANIAVLDGAAAGQPVPHAHAHVVPREFRDLPINDAVYDLIEHWSPDGQQIFGSRLEVPADEERRDRTLKQMEAEAREYRNALGPAAGLPLDSQRFGKFDIKGSQCFFTSPSGLTMAFVNLRPLVPGHVLVVPRRVVPLLVDLTEAEFEDLFNSVRVVQNMVERFYGASASNLGIQDGKAAGQTVPHVHVHILPRVEQR